MSINWKLRVKLLWADELTATEMSLEYAIDQVRSASKAQRDSVDILPEGPLIMPSGRAILYLAQADINELIALRGSRPKRFWPVLARSVYAERLATRA